MASASGGAMPDTSSNRAVKLGKRKSRWAPEALEFFKKAMTERHRLSQLQQRIPFMELPTEIRIQIYEELFKSPTPFESWHVAFEAFRFDSRSDFSNNSRKISSDLFSRIAVPALKTVLCLNKTINREATEVFYGAKEFWFSGSHAWINLNSFLSTIGSSSFQFIRSLTVHVPFTDNGSRVRTVKRILIDADEESPNRRSMLSIDSIFNREGIRVVSYNFEEAPDSHYLAFEKVCQKLGSVKSLKKLILHPPWNIPVSVGGSYRYFCEKPVCDETCGRTNNPRIWAWHHGRLYLAQLEKLQDKIPELEISISAPSPTMNGEVQRLRLWLHNRNYQQ